MADIVERLREFEDRAGFMGSYPNTVVVEATREAAAEILHLRTALAEAREVIEPFVQASVQRSPEMVKSINRNWRGYQPITVTVLKSQFVRARDFLTSTEKADG